MGLLGILFQQKTNVIDAQESGTGGALGQLQGVLRQTIGGVAGIVIDATVTEEHKTSCDLTENPVEDGAKITDHVQLKPAELTIEGVITDTPLGYAIIGNIQNIVRSVSTLFGKSSRSIDAYNDLLALQKSRRPFTVVTGLKRYENMILTELSVPRTVDTGKSLHFRAVMKEIRIVTSKTSTLSNTKNNALAKKAKNVGSKITDAVPQASQLSPTSTSVSGQNPSNLLGWIGRDISGGNGL